MLRVPGTTLLLCAISAALLLSALSLRATRSADTEKAIGAAKDAVDFNRQVRPLLAEHCLACHGPDRKTRQAGLRLDDKNSLFGRLASGSTAVVPGDVEQSELLRRVTSTDDSHRMPPVDATQAPLSKEEIAVLRQWIEQGAQWETHWAYQSPRRSPLPEVRQGDWPRGAIDVFLLARMEVEGLSPAKPATRAAWLRRVTFDLTGLPPTLAELDAFLADESPRAYETVVDRLLRSQRYGERMASHWLDLARYADTHGYHVDAHRDMWRWRDWVIDAFNNNMPFDQFTIEQLAGDLLPNATLEQRIASGCLRNGMINYENGSIAEEYRTEYVVDRVMTTSTVWMGQTMLCARCHDHKFDSLSQREFYSLYAFFNNVPENGLDGTSGNAVPLIKAPTREQVEQLARLKTRIARQSAALDELAAVLLRGQADWERELLAGREASSPPPADIRLHLPLDEQEGDKTQDSANALRHGLIHGPAIRVPGKFGNALLFTGDTSIDLGDAADYEHDTAFTAAAWVFPTTGDEMTLLARLADTSRMRGWVWSLNEGCLGLRLVNDGEENSLEVRAKQPIPRSQWRHVAVSYDGSSRAAGVTMYVAGEAVEVEVVRDALNGSIRNQRPLLVGRRGEAAPLRGMLDDVRLYKRALTSTDIARLSGGDPLREIVHIPAERRSPAQRDALRDYFLQQDETYRAQSDAIAAAQKELQSLEATIPTAMVMQEMESPRETRLLVRGDYRQPGEVISPDTPACLPPFPSDAPRNRLGLARWLVAPNHPLTARVTVNHFWQLIFGTGLVATSEDFGVRGETPSHPEMLDWLAVEFVESGWDVKRLLRMMVLSAAYRQSAVASKELHDRDPDNRLLSHGPLHRLPAEMIRDHALASSSLLKERLGGPSVFPYQPEGLWEEISFNRELYTAQVYVPSIGDDLYRRSLYTFWKRTAPPPTMLIFDAPDREICAMRRMSTSTPFQALTLMNDPTFVEAARKLAARMMTEGGSSPDDRIALAFRLLTSRRPSEHEIAVLRRVYEEQFAEYQNNADAAEQLLSVGESPYDKQRNRNELAAWTIVASMLFNFSETTIK